MLQTVRVEKVDEKIGVICLVSMFPMWVMVCNLSKKVHFLQFSKSVETIYIYASEGSHYILSENAMIYRGLSQKKMLTQQKFLKNSSWTIHFIPNDQTFLMHCSFLNFLATMAIRVVQWSKARFKFSCSNNGKQIS